MEHIVCQFIKHPLYVILALHGGTIPSAVFQLQQVLRKVVINISEEHIISIFRAEVE